MSWNSFSFSSRSLELKGPCVELRRTIWLGFCFLVAISLWAEEPQRSLVLPGVGLTEDFELGARVRTTRERLGSKYGIEVRTEPIPFDLKGSNLLAFPDFGVYVVGDAAGRIVQIVVATPEVVTDRYVSVGSPVQDVLRAYGMDYFYRRLEGGYVLFYNGIGFFCMAELEDAPQVLYIYVYPRFEAEWDPKGNLAELDRERDEKRTEQMRLESRPRPVPGSPLEPHEVEARKRSLMSELSGIEEARFQLMLEAMDESSRSLHRDNRLSEVLPKPFREPVE